ncbi:MAG: hypothetical protein LC109_12625, partial [Bacteroidia bacterium]|nr:hypothetical protein [Bacteroidia bacterium]
MKLPLKYTVLLVFLLFRIHVVLIAQGIYTHFGENRVDYKDFVWEKINSGADEIIYEKGQSFMAETILQQFDLEKKSLERELQYQLRSGVR